MRFLRNILDEQPQDNYGVQIEKLRGRIAALERALSYFLADERFDIAVGGNPHAVAEMMAEVRDIYQPQEN